MSVYVIPKAYTAGLQARAVQAGVAPVDVMRARAEAADLRKQLAAAQAHIRVLQARLTAAAAAPSTETANRILRVVAGHCGASVDDLLSASRSRHLAWPRQMALALIVEMCPLISLSQAGYLVCRNHTTVSHSVRAVHDRARAGTDPRWGAIRIGLGLPVETPERVRGVIWTNRTGRR
jgi:hypothetical protein